MSNILAANDSGNARKEQVLVDQATPVDEELQLHLQGASVGHLTPPEAQHNTGK